MKTVAQSKRRVRGTSRDDIVDVSRAIVENDGVEQLTIRRIAETIDRTQPAVYQHFESKDAILAAVVVDGFVALVARLRRAARGESVSLVALARAYVRFGIDRPKLYDLMFVGPPAIAFADPDATPTPARSAFELLASAVGAPDSDPAAVENATEVVWAALHGFVMLSITKRLRPGRVHEQMRFDALTAAITGIGSSTTETS